MKSCGVVGFVASVCFGWLLLACEPSMDRIYLDNAASTRLDPRVEEAMRPFFREAYGNPSSVHAAGREVRRAVEDAREIIASAIGGAPRELVFTSGGTEADNLALRGIVRPGRPRHVVVGAVEHPAVLSTAAALEKEGHAVTRVAATAEGIIDPAAVRTAMRPFDFAQGKPFDFAQDEPETALVSVMLANNETGAVQPVAEIARIAHEAKALLHTDAAQAFGKIPVDIRALGVDLLTISAHKIHGPKGCGALWVRRDVRFDPILHGGPHEFARRAGTENVPGIVGFAKAVELARAAMPEASPRMAALRDRLEAEILAKIPGASVNGPRDPARRLPNLLNVGIEGAEGQALLIHLDEAGICVSSGSACESASLEPSPVLLAMGRTEEQASNALRFSLSRETTPAEIERVLTVLPGIVERVRAITPSA